MTEINGIEVDETVELVATMLKKNLRTYEDMVELFKAAREAKKGNAQSPRIIMTKVERKGVSDEAKTAYDEAVSEFIDRVLTIADENPGILAQVFTDIASKGGRVFDYVLNEATNVASTVVSDDPVPTMEQMVKAKDKVNGLWTTLEASAEIEVIKALGVPCSVTKKGRANSSDKETWRPEMSELPKVSQKTDSTHLVTLTRNGTPVWETKADGSHETLDVALKRAGIRHSDFLTQLQLNLDSGGEKQQTVFTADFMWNSDHWKSEIREA